MRIFIQGRIKEAVAIARKATRVNGKIFNNVDERKYSVAQLKAVSGVSESYGLSDLFRTSNLRFRAINTAFQWFSIALCFYGLAFNTGGMTFPPIMCPWVKKTIHRITASFI